ncbi:MAG: hypothetical protein WDN06_00350 [Asticcacaulis sp.]
MTPSNYGNGLPGDIPGYPYSSADKVYNYLDTHNGGRIFGFYAPASFGVKETTQAYYVMTKIGGDQWRGKCRRPRRPDRHHAVQYILAARQR